MPRLFHGLLRKVASLGGASPSGFQAVLMLRPLDRRAVRRSRASASLGVQDSEHQRTQLPTVESNSFSRDVNGACFVTNDVPFAFDGSVNITLTNLLTGASSLLPAKPLALPPGAGVTEWWCADSGHAPPQPPTSAYSVTHNYIPAGPFAKADPKIFLYQNTRVPFW